MSLLAALVAVWLAVALIAVHRSRGVLRALWGEPVLRRPVMIIESDDWGAGSTEQAQVLQHLAGLLCEFRDAEGRRPVMTLGIVLAEPDREAMGRDPAGGYRRCVLSERAYQPIVESVQAGIRAGVFAAQLHGMEHYWPPALMAAARRDGGVREWLRCDAPTEALPSALQSRWVDASILPSRRLTDAEIEGAVAQEVEEFRAAFGVLPEVVVPPTFVWTEATERAWARHGVHVLVTPGRRYEARDSEGRPDRASAWRWNGYRTSAGLMCVVRDQYFEPSLGHDARRAFDRFSARSRLALASLLETHRFNFVADRSVRDASMAALRELLELVCRLRPETLFMSTGEFAVRVSARDPSLVDCSLLVRMVTWLERVGADPRTRRTRVVTGLALVAVVSRVLRRALGIDIPRVLDGGPARG